MQGLDVPSCALHLHLLHLETAPDGGVRVRYQVHAGGAHRAAVRQWQGQREEYRRVQAGGAGARHVEAGHHQGQREEV